MSGGVVVGIVCLGCCVFGIRSLMCGTKGRFAVQGKRLSGGIDAASWRFGIGRKLTFLVEEISDEHFLLTVESPKVWVISFGVLSKCRDGGAIFPRVGNVVIDAVESSDD